MTNVLVTGASGFIGRHLIKALPDAFILQDDINAPWFASFPQIDTVIHLAARFSDTNDFNTVNIDGTQHVIQFCRERQAKLIFASTNVYGKPERPLPITEDHPCHPANPYTASKYIAEQLIQRSGIPYVILRLSNVYGVGQKSQFLLPKICSQIPQKKVTLSTPTPKRDYIYISDVIDAFVAAMSYPQSGTFNIATGHSISVAEVIHTFQQFADFDVEYTHPNQVIDVPDMSFDPSLAKQELQWKAKVTWDEGTRKLWQKEPHMNTG